MIKRKPTTPGEILKEEFLIPLGLTQRELAIHIGCDIKVINRLVNGRTNLTASLALKLSKVFKTSPELWLNAQKEVDIFEAYKKDKKSISPFLILGEHTNLNLGKASLG